MTEYIAKCLGSMLILWFHLEIARRNGADGCVFGLRNLLRDVDLCPVAVLCLFSACIPIPVLSTVRFLLYLASSITLLWEVYDWYIFVTYLHLNDHELDTFLSNKMYY